MRKLYLLIAMLAVFVSACDIIPRETDNTSEKKDALSVVSCDIYFTPAGGEGSIVVDAEGTLLAQSAASWCHVEVIDNRRVVVKVDPSNSNMSRYSQITLTCQGDETYVVAEQTGIIIHEFAPEDCVEFAKYGGTVSYPYVSDTPITVTSTADWVVTTVNEDGLTIFVNEYDDIRVAEVNWAIQGYASGVISVRQNGRWKSLGNCQYTDGFMSAIFNVDDVTYEVEVQKSLEFEGVFRLVNPYGAAYPYNDPGDFETDPYHYMVIDARDRNAVSIQEFFSGMDWTYGEFIMRNTQPGKLENKVITFPANGLEVQFKDNPTYPSPFPANASGSFKVDLTQLSY